MREFAAALTLLAGLLLSGCATMAQGEARKEATAECDAKGMRFFETGATAREGLIVSTGGVTGECVGPSDPRYAEAIAPTEKP